jgi:hypothetical protein
MGLTEFECESSGLPTSRKHKAVQIVNDNPGTVRLMFNMIEAGQLPPSQRGHFEC